MFTKIRKSDVVIVAAMLATLTWNPCPAATQKGSGIWVQWEMTISLINLTNYPLTFKQQAPEQVGCGDLLDTNKSPPWQVEPYRTKMWSSTGICDRLGVGPYANSYEGTVTLYTQGFPNTSGFPGCKAFDLVFRKDAISEEYNYGTWVSLSPSYFYEGPDTGWKDWWAVNQWGYGRWATPFNEDPPKMHNVMTLIGSACMVTLYSSDNKNLVVVVQQYYQKSSSAVTWTDPSNWNDQSNYGAYALDFVDNGGSSVPGQ